MERVITMKTMLIIGDSNHGNGDDHKKVLIIGESNYEDSDNDIDDQLR
jgi:hypothetical protein